MRNVISTIAKRSLNNHKKRSVYLFVSIFITTALFIGIMTYIDSLINQKEQDNIQNYGSYYYAIENIDDQQKEILINHPYVQEVNELHFYGTFEAGNIGYTENFSLLPITIEKGRMPNNENEIILEKNVLLQMLIPLEINQVIEIEYQLIDGQTRQEEFILTGIYSASENLLTSSLQAITTKRSFPSSTNYYYISDGSDSLVEGSNTIQNSSVIPSMLGETYESYYARQSLLIVASLIGMILIMYTMNLIASDITKELILLRMMGAAKMQVAMLFFYQLGMIALVAVPLSLLVGYGICFMVCHFNSITFLFKLESLFYTFIILGLTLFLGTVFPVIKATQLALSGSTRLKKKVKKVRTLKQITILNLTKRHMKFNRSSHLLFVVVAALAISFLVNNIIIVARLLQSGDSTPSNTIVHLQTFDDSLQGEMLDEVSQVRGVQSVSGIGHTTIEVELPLEDIYSFDTQNENVKSNIRIFNIDENHELYPYIQDNQAIIYLPSVYRIDYGDGSYGYYSDLPTEDEKYELIQDTRIKVGDKIPLFNQEVSISYIATDHEQLLNDSDFYSIYVSKEFIENYTTDIYYSNARAELKDGFDQDNVITKIMHVLNQYDTQIDIYVDEDTSRDRVSTLIVRCIYCISILLMIILLLFQQVHTQFHIRGQDISLYQMIGMDDSQVKKIFLYEGYVLIGRVILLNVLLTLSPQLISILNFGSLSDFNFFDSFPLESLPVYLVVYLIIFGIIMGIYSSTSKRILKIDKLDRLRQIT